MWSALLSCENGHKLDDFLFFLYKCESIADLPPNGIYLAVAHDSENISMNWTIFSTPSHFYR